MHFSEELLFNPVFWHRMGLILLVASCSPVLPHEPQLSPLGNRMES